MTSDFAPEDASASPAASTTPTVGAAEGAPVPLSAGRRAALTAMRCLDHASGWIVGVVFFFGISAYTHFKDVVEFDPDEGNNVIKALLVDRGHRFLDSIWSDQPPLFSYILKVVFDLTSWNAVNARFTVLFFSALLVAVLYDLLRRDYGHQAAICGVTFLTLSNLYVPLSVSVMIGLPAISMAAMGVWALAGWKRSGRRLYLVVSGAFLAAAFATKMFVGFLPPLCVVVLGIWSWRRHQRPEIRAVGWDVACWCVTFAVVGTAALAPVLTAADPLAVYRAHNIASTNASIGGLTGAVMLRQFGQEDIALFTGAILGLVGVAVDRRPGSLLMALWFLLAGAALYRHQPVWPHHRLLVTVPGACLAAVGVEKALEGILQRSSGRLTRVGCALGVSCFVFLLGYCSPEKLKHMRTPTVWSQDKNDVELFAELAPYRGKTKFMLTSRQMYAFRMGMEVPPNLAVTSVKRFRTGLLNSNTIVESLEKYQPGLVILTTRWSKPVRTKVKRALDDKYVRIFSDRLNHRVEVFVRRDIATPEDLVEETEG